MKRKANVLSLYEIMQTYKTRDDAIRYFKQIRWGDKPVCVKCGCDGRITPQQKTGDYWCGDCRGYFNAFTNTPLERNKVDPRKWIYAAYTLITSRKGIASLQLSKEICVQQRTAWYMLHRMRLVCGENLEALHGEVELDATYLGGLEKNKHSSKKLKSGCGTVGKQAVLEMKERDGKVKAMVVEGEDKGTIHNAITENIEVGATIYTDEHRGYMDIEGEHYSHKAVKHSAKEYVNGMVHTNGVESIWSTIKRGFNGTYHHWSKKHCQQYINEFTFRLNEGNVDRDTQDRLDDLFRNMVGKNIMYKELVS